MKFKINNEIPKININTYDANKKSANNINMFDNYEEIDYSQVTTFPEYQNFNTSQDNITYKKEKLEELKKLASNDSQINNSGDFSKFTDFQNIMLSDLSLMELVFEGFGHTITNKTIGELYMESISEQENENIEYDKIILDADKMIEMSKKENWSEYRNLVLGKLVRYGFADLKVIEAVNGKDGFDAFVLEDTAGNKMVYFPCTNLVEHEDYLYDIFPILSNINAASGLLANTFCKRIYDSQQKQAEELLEKVIRTNEGNGKVNVSGFSLGGSLAEHAYLDSYKKNPNSLGNIVLYNPYHNVLSKEDCNILKQDNRMKLYTCEGDTVSGVFNYSDFSDVSKPIFIDYKNRIKEKNESIDKHQGILNEVVNSFKNEYIDHLINKCDNAKSMIANNSFMNIPEHLINLTMENLQGLKKLNIPLSEVLSSISIPIEKTFIANILEEKTDFSKFLLNMSYVETILTDTHLTCAADANKNISFDESGNVKTVVEVNGQNHKVDYPSFSQTNSSFLGDIINILNIKK